MVNANVATATKAATPAEAQVFLSANSEYVMPSKASTPAKPSPHSVGTRSASTIPSSEAPCQLNQFHAALPQKYGSCSGCGLGSEKRRANST